MRRRDLELRAHIAAEAKAAAVALRGPFYARADAGLHPEARQAAARLREAGLAHGRLDHVCSSQAFALNLFAGADPDGLIEMMACLGPSVAAVGEPTFEWTDPGWLGEATAASPHATQIDVALFSRLADGRRHLLLVEVKLIEEDFSTCSALQSRRNDSLGVCRSEGPFGRAPDACFQLRNHDRGTRRRYDEHLGLADGTQASGDVGGAGCWFRGGSNQVMRQVALANAARANGVVEEVAVGLCAPWAHRRIWRRWAEAKAALGSAGVPLVALPADAVVSVLQPVLGPELARRYRLGTHDPAFVAIADVVITTLSQWAAEGLEVENPDAGDGYAEVRAVTLRHDPRTPSQLVLDCDLGFNVYPYAVSAPVRFDQRRDVMGLRLLSGRQPRWILSRAELNAGGLTRNRLAPTRLQGQGIGG